MHGGGCVTGLADGAVCHMPCAELHDVAGAQPFRGLYFLVFTPKFYALCRPRAAVTKDGDRSVSLHGPEAGRPGSRSG